MSLPSIPTRKSFYHQAATCSVWLLLFPFVVQFASVGVLSSLPPQDAALPHLFFSLIIGLGMLAGVILGIVSLFGIRQYGTKGILIKALFGILVPLLLFLLSIPVVMHARELALRIQAQQHASQPANP